MHYSPLHSENLYSLMEGLENYVSKLPLDIQTSLRYYWIVIYGNWFYLFLIVLIQENKENSLHFQYVKYPLPSSSKYNIYVQIICKWGGSQSKPSETHCESLKIWNYFQIFLCSEKIRNSIGYLNFIILLIRSFLNLFLIFFFL